MDKYLMYLRKSRADVGDEPVMQTLQRHRMRLEQLCESLHIHVDEGNVLYEVASGDSIASRPLMMELLHRVETGAFAGVLCVDMDRLSRGSGADQALVINTFKYSNTRIITPQKTYDFSLETDEQFAELGLFLGRAEYRTIKKRLMQGRIDSAREGKFCTGNPPYGYQTYKLEKEKGYSLKIVPEQAAIVREMFDMYSHKGMGYKLIAAALNARGSQSNHGPWTASHVYKILNDPTYCGKIRFRYKIHEKQMRDGQIVKTEHRNPGAILVPGLHEAIIPEELFNEAQAVKKTRRTPHIKIGFQMANPFCSLVHCAYCGKNLALAKDKKGVYRLHCITPGCNNHDIILPIFEERVIKALTAWLEAYEFDQPTNSKAGELERAQKATEALTEALDKETKRQGRIMELLEQGVYSVSDYQIRIAASREAAENLKAQLVSAQGTVSTLSQYEQARVDLVPSVQDLLTRYYSLPTPREKNLLLKNVVEYIVVEKPTKGRGTEQDFDLTVFPKLPR